MTLTPEERAAHLRIPHPGEMTKTVETRKRVAERIAQSCGWKHAQEMREAIGRLLVKEVKP